MDKKPLPQVLSISSIELQSPATAWVILTNILYYDSETNHFNSPLNFYTGLCLHIEENFDTAGAVTKELMLLWHCHSGVGSQFQKTEKQGHFVLNP